MITDTTRPRQSTTRTTPTTSPVQPKRRRAVVVEITRVIDIEASPGAVFAYASDFRRAHEWRTEVVESTMEPSGPMRAGSRLREMAVVAGRQLVTDSVVDVFEPSRRFTFCHVAGLLPVSGEYRVEPRLAESRTDAATLRYTLRLHLAGGWRLLAPLLTITAPATVRRSLRTLATRVEAAAS